MSAQVVYISSDERSGSTLLDQLLGSHPRVHSVGEMHHLGEYANRDRSHYDPAHPLICTCGKAVPDCDFWSEVERHVQRSLQTFQLNPYLAKAQGREIPGSRRRRRFVRQVEARPWLYRYQLVRRISGGMIAAIDSFKLFDAIAAVAGVGSVIDSSKSPFRFTSLFYQQPERMKLILLARDYRGVVHSKMKRGKELATSLAAWSQRLHQMELMCKLVPDADVMRLKYEELCLDSEKVMRDVCTFIGVGFDSAVLGRSSQNLHHIGGSPSKFMETKQEIRLDESHLTVFSADELEFMRKNAGPEAVKWGYVS